VEKFGIERMADISEVWVRLSDDIKMTGEASQRYNWSKKVLIVGKPFNKRIHIS